MKKIILILFSLLCVISQLKTYADTVSSSIDADGNFSYKITHTEKYYCPDSKNSKNAYDERYLYSPTDNCDVWNNDFWKNSGADLYKLCLDNKKAMAQKVKDGACDKITVERYEENGAICEFEVTKEYKKIVRTTCINGDLNTLRKNFMKKNGYK